MIPEYFSYVSAVILFASGLSYIVATIRGEAQPNRVTWFFWAVAPLIAAIAAVNKGVGLAALPVAMTGIMPLLVFISSFVNKNAYWKINTFDYACGIAAFLALLLWYLTSNATIAIVFSIVADLFASTPTVIKAYTNPESEDGRAFILGTIAMVIAVFAVQQLTFDALAFSINALFINALIALEVYRRTFFTPKAQ